MSRDTHAPPGRDVPATVRLRIDRFELMTRIVGAANIASRARLIGVDRKTMRLILDGRQEIGEVFMAKTVAALRRHTDALAACGLTPSLDELFEVVEAKQLAGAA